MFYPLFFINLAKPILFFIQVNYAASSDFFFRRFTHFQFLSQIEIAFRLAEGQYLTQIKFKIVKQRSKIPASDRKNEA